MDTTITDVVGAGTITVQPDMEEGARYEALKVAHLPRDSKGHIFRILAQSIPTTDYKTPEFIYRADLIPIDWFTNPSYTNEERSDILNAATINVVFTHGYPAIDDTDPFWERLPGESDKAYNAFLSFLELPEKSDHENPIRLLPLIAQLIKEDVKQVQDWCYTFFWHWRARAYDLFLIAAHKKQREQRILSIEGRHFSIAEKILAKVDPLMLAKLDQEILALTSSGDDEEGGGEVKLKELADIMEKMVRIQRQSLGLSTGSQVTVETGPKFARPEDQYKEIAKEGESEAASATRRPSGMDQLLSSPDDLSKIQELLIRQTHPEMRSVTRAHNFHETTPVEDAEIIEPDEGGAE